MPFNITLAGPFTHLEALITRLQPHYTVRSVSALNQATDLIVEEFPVLVLIDGDQPGWRTWVSALKTDQATRRIPLVVTTLSETNGTDGFLCRCLQDDDFLRIIRGHAHVITSETADQLDCQCQDNLPPLAQLGVERFNQGEYYLQHDAFEALWMAENGPVRELYRAILQVGIAYYHITHGNYEGGLKMLRRCVQWFAVLPDECQGIDVRQLREDAAHVRAALLAISPDDIHTFDRALLKPVPRITYD